jgi:hypothetical protein
MLLTYWLLELVLGTNAYSNALEMIHDSFSGSSFAAK